MPFDLNEHLRSRLPRSGQDARVILLDGNERWARALGGLCGLVGRITAAGGSLDCFERAPGIGTGEGAAFIASRLAEGSVDLIAAGGSGAAETLDALLSPGTGFCGGRAFGVSCHAPPLLGRLLFVTDTAVTREPSVECRAEAGIVAARLAQLSGVARPRIAMLAAVEKVYPAVPRTVEAAGAAEIVNSRCGDAAFAAGPLSMDVAVLEDAAREKGAAGEVAGRADVLVAPDLPTAAGLCSVFTHFAKVQSGMAILGGKVPVAIASDLDSVETIAHSLLLALLACHLT